MKSEKAHLPILNRVNFWRFDMSLMSDLQIKKEGIINKILEECGAIKDDDITADSVKMKENVNDLSQKKTWKTTKTI